MLRLPEDLYRGYSSNFIILVNESLVKSFVVLADKLAEGVVNVVGGFFEKIFSRRNLCRRMYLTSANYRDTIATIGFAIVFIIMQINLLW